MPFSVPTPFVWDPSFDVGSKLFNEQHVKLFAMIDDLDHHQADKAKLAALLDYAVAHFKAEEAAFESHKFADAVAHKAIHDKFVTDAVAATQGGVVNDGIIKFLKEWLVTHIKGSDMTYKGKV
jgi:hemerythrin family non-heme iron protein